MEGVRRRGSESDLTATGQSLQENLQLSSWYSFMASL